MAMLTRMRRGGQTNRLKAKSAVEFDDKLQVSRSKKDKKKNKGKGDHYSGKREEGRREKEGHGTGWGWSRNLEKKGEKKPSGTRPS